MEKWNDEHSKTLQFRLKSLRIFVKAFNRYIELAAPYATNDNVSLFQEYIEVQKFQKYINERIEGGGGDFDTTKIGFMGKNWGKIYDLIWKYSSWKKQLLDEKKLSTSIKAALEGEEKELEEIREVLSNPVWETFNRHRILIDSFYEARPPQRTNDPIVQQYFNVENLNGILTGTNTGTITQNNQNKEVLSALKELALILKEGHISDQYTAQALENIREFQGELLNPYPDKTKMQKAAEGLQFLANFSQLASFTISISPHIHTIQQYVTNLL